MVVSELQGEEMERDSHHTEKSKTFELRNDNLSTNEGKHPLHKSNDMENCPLLMKCESVITKDYFARICYTKRHTKCHYFAKMMSELKTPIDWLQRLAIQLTR
jgi:hypothetical protein